jgi:hypothetical protein
LSPTRTLLRSGNVNFGASVLEKALGIAYQPRPAEGTYRGPDFPGT